MGGQGHRGQFQVCDRKMVKEEEETNGGLRGKRTGNLISQKKAACSRTD